MFIKLLELYKKLISNNKKSIPIHIILCIIVIFISFVGGLIAGAKNQNKIVIVAYVLLILFTFITCVLYYRLRENSLENDIEDYNENVLGKLESKIDELKMGSNKCIKILIEQCKEYEKVEKDGGLKKIKYIFGIAIIPLITSAGKIIFSQMDDKGKIAILIVSALVIGVGVVILNLLYESYINIIYDYNYYAKKMRYDLELILALRKLKNN